MRLLLSLPCGGLFCEKTNMEVVTIEVLQAWFPSLKSQEELNKAIAIIGAFGFLDINRVDEYAGICKEISDMQDHGDSNIEIQIRDGEIISQMYGKRKKKLTK